MGASQGKWGFGVEGFVWGVGENCPGNLGMGRVPSTDVYEEIVTELSFFLNDLCWVCLLFLSLYLWALCRGRSGWPYLYFIDRRLRGRV